MSLFPYEDVYGYLKKKKGSSFCRLFGNTNQRWFELRFNQSIFGYKKRRADQNYKLKIDIKTITNYIPTINKKDVNLCDWNYGFQLICQKKNFVLFSQTKEEFEKWGKAFSFILGRTKPNHSKNKEEQKVQIKESNGMKAEKKVTFADDDIKKKNKTVLENKKDSKEDSDEKEESEENEEEEEEEDEEGEEEESNNKANSIENNTQSNKGTLKSKSEITKEISIKENSIKENPINKLKNERKEILKNQNKKEEIKENNSNEKNDEEEEGEEKEEEEEEGEEEEGEEEDKEEGEEKEEEEEDDEDEGEKEEEENKNELEDKESDNKNENNPSKEEADNKIDSKNDDDLTEHFPNKVHTTKEVTENTKNKIPMLNIQKVKEDNDKEQNQIIESKNKTVQLDTNRITSQSKEIVPQSTEREHKISSSDKKNINSQPEASKKDIIKEETINEAESEQSKKEEEIISDDKKERKTETIPTKDLAFHFEPTESKINTSNIYSNAKIEQAISTIIDDSDKEPDDLNNISDQLNLTNSKFSNSFINCNNDDLDDWNFYDDDNNRIALNDLKNFNPLNFNPDTKEIVDRIYRDKNKTKLIEEILIEPSSELKVSGNKINNETNEEDKDSCKLNIKSVINTPNTLIKPDNSVSVEIIPVTLVEKEPKGIIPNMGLNAEEKYMHIPDAQREIKRTNIVKVDNREISMNNEPNTLVYQKPKIANPIDVDNYKTACFTMNENKKSQQKKENLIDIMQINEEFSNDDVLGTYERNKNTSALIYSKQRDNTFSSISSNIDQNNNYSYNSPVESNNNSPSSSFEKANLGLNYSFHSKNFEDSVDISNNNLNDEILLQNDNNNDSFCENNNTSLDKSNELPHNFYKKKRIKEKKHLKQNVIEPPKVKVNTAIDEFEKWDI